jgi:hypothetical protein
MAAIITIDTIELTGEFLSESLGLYLSFGSRHGVQYEPHFSQHAQYLRSELVYAGPLVDAQLDEGSAAQDLSQLLLRPGNDAKVGLGHHVNPGPAREARAHLAPKRKLVRHAGALVPGRATQIHHVPVVGLE